MLHRRSFIAGLGAFLAGGAGTARAVHEPWFWGGLGDAELGGHDMAGELSSVGGSVKRSPAAATQAGGLWPSKLLRSPERS